MSMWVVVVVCLLPLSSRAITFCQKSHAPALRFPSALSHCPPETLCDLGRSVLMALSVGDASYLSSIFNCASCNTANGNTGSTQLSDFQSLQDSCKNQGYTGADQSFVTEAPPSPATGEYGLRLFLFLHRSLSFCVATTKGFEDCDSRLGTELTSRADGYVAPTLTATGGGAAATGDATATDGVLAAGAGAAAPSAAAPVSGGAGAAVAASGAGAAAVSGAASGAVKAATVTVVQAAAASSGAASPNSFVPALGGMVAVLGAVVAVL